MMCGHLGTVFAAVIYWNVFHLLFSYVVPLIVLYICAAWLTATALQPTVQLFNFVFYMLFLVTPSLSLEFHGVVNLSMESFMVRAIRSLSVADA